MNSKIYSKYKFSKKDLIVTTKIWMFNGIITGK